MKLDPNVVKLSASDISLRSNRLDSEGVRASTAKSEFVCDTESGVVRYRINLPEFKDSESALFVFGYTINVFEGSVSHISIVNSDVSDGYIWDIREPDYSGVFTLSAIVRNKIDSVIIYLNVLRGSGRFSLEFIDIHRIVDVDKMSCCVYVDPWVERSLVTWKSDYVWWFDNLCRAINKFDIDVRVCFIVGEHIAQFLDYYKVVDAECVIIKSSDLLSIYGGHRRGIEAQRERANLGVGGANERFVSLVRAQLPFHPDFVFSMSDTQVLKDIFPSSTIFFRDAVYCRGPFPDELTSFDTVGLYKNSSISRRLELCKVDSDYNDFISEFFPRDPVIFDLLEKYSIPIDGFVLLPLQDSRHINFYGESVYSDQMDFLIDVLTQYPTTPVVITQHPDNREIGVDDVIALQSVYKHLRYIPELDLVKNPTARLLPFCELLGGVSTGLIYQALMIGKKVHFFGRHALDAYDFSRMEAGNIIQTGRFLINCFFASYHYVLNPKWLVNRLMLLVAFSTGYSRSGAMAIDLPGNILRNLRNSRRHPE